MTRISWERLAALAGVAFDSSNRMKEAVAFFFIAAAALAFVVFAGAYGA